MQALSRGFTVLKRGGLILLISFPWISIPLFAAFTLDLPSVLSVRAYAPAPYCGAKSNKF
jgi:hypothetical protein